MSWQGRTPPIAWAAHRQELCETLPYFRSYHGGIYAKTAAPIGSASLGKRLRAEARGESKPDSTWDDDPPAVHRDATAFSYLLGGFGAPRDVWAERGRVIISHGGGKSAIVKGGKEEGKADDEDDLDAIEVDELLSITDDKTERVAKGNARVALQESQSMSDFRIAALLQSHETTSPVVLIASKDYALSHIDLGSYFAQNDCNYVVLGWYWVTHAWQEGQDAPTRKLEAAVQDSSVLKRWKIRFQYVHSQGTPWWLQVAHKTSNNFTKREDSHQIPSCSDSCKNRALSTAEVQYHAEPCQRPETFAFEAGHSSIANTRKVFCVDCGKASPSLYEGSFICLNGECSSFWQRDTFDGPSSAALMYRIDFLRCLAEHDALQKVAVPFSLEPSHNAKVRQKPYGSLLGLHCPQCRRLSCRTKQDHWHCEYCHHLEYVAPKTIARMSAKHRVITRLEENCVVQAGSRIIMSVRTKPQARIITFHLPPKLGNGKIHVLQGGKHIQDVCDELLDHIGSQILRGLPDALTNAASPSVPEAIHFKRHTLLNHRGAGKLLSQQFTSNYGVPYRHSVETSTRPLKEAPQTVHRALGLLEEATRLALTEDISNTFKDYRGPAFNEVYPALYLASQTMHYHDDGEPGLGPVIATLSLGDSTKMHFRLKANTMSKTASESPTDLHTVEEESTGSSFSTEDNDEARTNKAGSTKANNASRRLLSIPLPHGCIVLQEGHSIQEKLEHAIEPDEAVRVLAREKSDRCATLRDDALEALQKGRVTSVGFRIGLTARHLGPSHQEDNVFAKRCKSATAIAQESDSSQDCKHSTPQSKTDMKRESKGDVGTMQQPSFARRIRLKLTSSTLQSSPP